MVVSISLLAIACSTPYVGQSDLHTSPCPGATPAASTVRPLQIESRPPNPRDVTEYSAKVGQEIVVTTLFTNGRPAGQPAIMPLGTLCLRGFQVLPDGSARAMLIALRPGHASITMTDADPVPGADIAVASFVVGISPSP